ncbi:hypothetical protein [Bradyrhizobium zhanjiangense]|uniref:hypothetical protein n=1 Tax=Bradyrhizobium zhanjiangense TaxID=1325107 RepID=UPI001008DDAC|nr:hypothetical protein [Bradyrhizobium zhanjiangense]
MPTATPHVLIEMPDEPDCRFFAAWLTQAAEAQGLWSKALEDPEFSDRVGILHVIVVPDLAIRALAIFEELGRGRHVAALALYPEDDYGEFSVEFGLLVQLGLFVHVDESYRMAVPESIALEKVKQAALDVVATAEDQDGIELVQPERLLHTLSKTEAEDGRSIRLAMRRFRLITG